MRTRGTLSGYVSLRWIAPGAGTGQDADLADGSDPSPSYLSRGPLEEEGGENGRPVSVTQSEHTNHGSVAADISNAVVRVLSEYTGRGPTRARTHMNDELISVVLRDTLTKGERSLVASGKAELVLAARKAYQDAMGKDLITAVERYSGRKVLAFLSDNHLDPDIGVESFVLEPRSDDGERQQQSA